MKLEVLDADKARIIRLQSGIVKEGGFFLAGGTGLAIRLGHRLSDDLDWFTSSRFDARVLLDGLKALPEKPTAVRQDGRQTVRAFYGSLKTSFIVYEQVPSKVEILAAKDFQIPVADVELLAAMKAAAAHDRGARRDLVDVHAISRLPAGPLVVSSSTVRTFCHWSGARSPELSHTSWTLIGSRCRVTWDKVTAELLLGVREWERSKQARPGSVNDHGRRRPGPPAGEGCRRLAASRIDTGGVRHGHSRASARGGPPDRGATLAVHLGTLGDQDQRELVPLDRGRT